MPSAISSTVGCMGSMPRWRSTPRRFRSIRTERSSARRRRRRARRRSRGRCGRAGRARPPACGSASASVAMAARRARVTLRRARSAADAARRSRPPRPKAAASWPTSWSSSACLASAVSSSPPAERVVGLRPQLLDATPVGRRGRGRRARRRHRPAPGDRAAVGGDALDDGRRGRGRDARRPGGRASSAEVAQALGVLQPDAGAVARTATHHFPSRASVGRTGCRPAAEPARPRRPKQGERRRAPAPRRGMPTRRAAALASIVAAARSPAASRRRASSTSNVTRSHGSWLASSQVDGGLAASAMASADAPLAASVRARAAAARPSNAGDVEVRWCGPSARRRPRWRRRGRPRPSSASTSTVSSSTARSRSSPMARRPRSAVARARSWSPRARCRRAAGSSACSDWSLPSSSASASARRPWRMRRSASAMSGCQLGTCITASKLGLGPDEDGLGLGPPAELDEQRGVDAVAVAGQEHRSAGRQRDQPVLAQQAGPRSGALEVGGEVAGGEERAHRLGSGAGVVGRPARQRHGLVEQRHALGHPAGLHVGQPGVGERLGLEVDVAEPTGPVEGQLGGGQQLGGVVDVAAHRRHGHPPLLEAGGWSSTSRRARANHARLAVRLPMAVASTSPRRTQAIAARHGSSAAVKPRIAADRCATIPSTSPRCHASSAATSACSDRSRSSTAPRMAPVDRDR